MDLAREYGIHAFCYYHYWFDGKLLLQKPLEAIRDYQGVKLNYFLCWANELGRAPGMDMKPTC